jgi:hypothetical protein
MKIYDIQCQCGAQYKCAESETLVGKAGIFVCVACGSTVKSWETASKLVCRFILGPDKAYLNVNPPPAP